MSDTRFHSPYTQHVKTFHFLQILTVTSLHGELFMLKYHVLCANGLIELDINKARINCLNIILESDIAFWWVSDPLYSTYSIICKDADFAISRDLADIIDIDGKGETTEYQSLKWLAWKGVHWDWFLSQPIHEWNFHSMYCDSGYKCCHHASYYHATGTRYRYMALSTHGDWL